MIKRFYPNAEISATMEKTTTGNFDVDIDGKRVHSKKGNGDDFPSKDWVGFLGKVKAAVEE